MPVFEYQGAIILGANTVLEWPELQASLDDYEGIHPTAATIFVNMTLDSASANAISRTTSQSATDESVANALDSLRARGIRSILNVATGMRHDGFNLWQGNLAPTDPAAWFASLKSHLLHYAGLAEAGGADTLVIGQELVQMTRAPYRDYWVDIIGAVREVFHGKVSYGVHAAFPASPTEEINTISFVDQLDIVGINLYPKMAISSDAGVQDMVDGWRHDRFGNDLVEVLRDFSQKHDKPLMFTEIGVGSYDGAAIDAAIPMLDPAQGTVDDEEQRRFYEAFFQVWANEAGSWMKGVNFWYWPPVDEAGTRGGWLGWPKEHIFQDKPAEDVVRAWYGDERQGPGFAWVGGGNADFREGGYNHDTLSGSAGADTLDGRDGNDLVHGGQGNDLLTGWGGDDTLQGGRGSDVIFGNAGVDHILGQDDDDTVHAGKGADIVEGDAGRDYLFGNNDEDLVFGGDGDDTIHGGKENDLLRGESGNDFLSGDMGDDTLFGGAGADFFVVSSPGDRIGDFTALEGDQVLDAGFNPIDPTPYLL